jgi:hypothetical protein
VEEDRAGCKKNKRGDWSGPSEPLFVELELPELFTKIKNMPEYKEYLRILYDHGLYPHTIEGAGCSDAVGEENFRVPAAPSAAAWGRRV